MSLLNQLMSKSRKADIGYGVHENCVVLEISNDKRKNKDGVVIKRNCFTKIGKLNDSKEVVAEKEISWFDIDSTSEYAYDNFFSQIEQMTAIVDAIRDPETDGKDLWGLAFDAILENEGIELSVDGLKGALKEKKKTASLMEAIGDLYVELLEPLVGPESPAIRFKVVYDNNGKYLQQPRYGEFVESMEIDAVDSRLKMSKTELDYKAKADNITSAPAPSSKPKVNI